MIFSAYWCCSQCPQHFEKLFLKAIRLTIFNKLFFFWKLQRECCEMFTLLESFLSSPPLQLLPCSQILHTSDISCWEWEEVGPKECFAFVYLSWVLFSEKEFLYTVRPSCISLSGSHHCPVALTNSHSLCRLVETISHISGMWNTEKPPLVANIGIFLWFLTGVYSIWAAVSGIPWMWRKTKKKTWK